MHDSTSRCRVDAVSAASEKYLDQVQPPSDRSTFSPGCIALSARSCWKLPRSGSPHTTGTPSTDVVASQVTP